MTLELPTLPEKDFFSMGEISRIAGVPAHTLRYWERRIGFLKPARLSSGHRRYTRQDISTISEIREMIERRKMTLAGARRAWLESRRGRATPDAGSFAKAPDSATRKILREVGAELKAIARELETAG
jgi:DNA-binding transcriptional MerR regulator